MIRSVVIDMTDAVVRTPQQAPQLLHGAHSL